MLFDWDARKSDRNFRERGFDFEFAARIFRDDTEEFIDDRKDYGEIRIIAFGTIDGDLYAVIYTLRDNIHWIISSFRCRPKELKRWKQRAGGRSVPAVSTEPRSKPPRNTIPAGT